VRCSCLAPNPAFAPLQTRVNPAISLGQFIVKVGRLDNWVVDTRIASRASFFQVKWTRKGCDFRAQETFDYFYGFSESEPAITGNNSTK